MTETDRRVKPLTAAALCAAVLAPGVAIGATSEMEMILELKKIIEQQQEQLSKQSAQIESLQQKITGISVAEDRKEAPQEPDQVAADDKTASAVVSALDNVDISLYGQINRAVMFTDNGDTSETYFVDNTHSSSRMGLDLNVGVSDDFSIGGKIEYEFRSSPSASVDQINTTVTDDTLRLRHSDIYFTSGRYGKISLGKGSMAADGTSTLDLSGTTVVANSCLNDMAGSQFWSDGTATTDLRISDVVRDLDGGRDDRVRYDSPSFYGFVGSSSIAADDKYDLTLRYNREYDGAKVAAAVAWQSPDDDDIDNIYNGSMAVLFQNGFNIALSGGVEDSDIENEGTYWYAKVGYRAEIFEFGKTSFSVDYGRFDDFDVEGGEGDAYSLAVVQDVPDWGTEFYLAFRQYMYEEDITDYEDINVVMSGARLKF